MGGDYRRHAAFVYERDGWTCKLCGLPVAKNRKAPHPLAPSLDHVTPQILGGSDEPDNLQTAHLRCNDSKHTAPQRGSSLRVVMQASPEVLELLRRLPPLPEPDEPRQPLPQPSADNIGDVFDACVELVRREQAGRLPDVEDMRRWVCDKGFLTLREARYAVQTQIAGCFDYSEVCESVCERVMEQHPQAWFVAKFFMEGEGPEWLDDEDGWQEVADALVDYAAFDEVDRTIDEVVGGLSVPDPLQVVEVGPEPASCARPGMYRGHPLWAYEESIRELKRADRLAECEQLLLGLIGSLEAFVSQEGGSLSPHFYEQLAIVRRKMRDASGEVEVLERYFRHAGALDSIPLRERLAKVRAKRGAG